MLSPPSSPALAGAQSVAVAAFFLVLGWLVADALWGRREGDRSLSWGLAVAGTALFALLLMVLHMVSGGRVFASAWLTRGLTLAAFAALAGRRILGRRDGRTEPPPTRRMVWIAATCS
jgi:hypothetical protein